MDRTITIAEQGITAVVSYIQKDIVTLYYFMDSEKVKATKYMADHDYQTVYDELKRIGLSETRLNELEDWYDQLNASDSTGFPYA